MGRNISSEGAAGLAGCGLFLVYIVAALTIGGYCTEYTFEFWLSYAKGVPVDLPFWICCVASLFMQGLTIPLAIITYILSFAL